MFRLLFFRLDCFPNPHQTKHSYDIKYKYEWSKFSFTSRQRK